MQVYLALVWEISFCVPVGRQSSLLFHVTEVSKKGITFHQRDILYSCTVFMDIELRFSEKSKYLFRQLGSLGTLNSCVNGAYGV